MNIKEALSAVIEPILTKEGYLLYELSYGKEGADMVLHVYVDQDDQVIDLDEIVRLSELISPALDEANIIAEDYMLDVASAGAEKRIDVARLDKYLHRYVNLHLIAPFEGENFLEGEIIEVNEETVTLAYRVKTREKKTTLARANIDKARLAIKF